MFHPDVQPREVVLRYQEFFRKIRAEFLIESFNVPGWEGMESAQVFDWRHIFIREGYLFFIPADIS